MKGYLSPMATGNVIESKWDAVAAKARANAAAVRALLEEVRGQEEAIRSGGGKKAVEAQHAKGRLTARERIGLLVDRDLYTPPQTMEPSEMGHPKNL